MGSQIAWRDLTPSTAGTKKRQADKPTLNRLSPEEARYLANGDTDAEHEAHKRAFIMEVLTRCQTSKVGHLFIRYAAGDMQKLYRAHSLTPSEGWGVIEKCWGVRECGAGKKKHGIISFPKSLSDRINKEYPA